MKRHKHFLKISSILLAVVLVLCSVGAVASAAEKTTSGMIDILASESNAQFTTQNRGAIEAVRDGALKLQDRIDISGYNLSVEDMKPLFAAVRACYPELFFLGLSYRYEYKTVNGKDYATAFIPSYEVSSADELNTKLDAFYAKADEYLSLVDDSMNDFTKALILHDAIVMNSEYFITKNNVSGTPYTLMVEGWGKCEDYTRAYAFLLAQAGIKSEIISSDSMNHEWMKIRLGGRYYQVDVTWDGPTSPYEHTDLPGRISHDYFLYSDSAFRNHSGYPQINPSSDTTFDNYYLHNMRSQFCMVRGALYGIYTDGDSGKFKLVTYTADNQMTTVFDIASAIESEEGRWATLWNAGGSSYYTRPFANLGVYDGLLYYNIPKAVYVYDPASNTNLKLAQYSGENQLFGMKIKDGKVYGNDVKDPNYSGTLVEVCDCLRMGDIEDNGILNVVDATKIQRYLAELEKFGAKELIKADYDHDGVISVIDATAIQFAIAQ